MRDGLVGTNQDLAQDDIDIRKLTQAQLMQLGMSQLAYVKPVWMDGETAFAIFAADGSPMAVAADCDLAVAAIVQRERVTLRAVCGAAVAVVGVVLLSQGD